MLVLFGVWFCFLFFSSVWEGCFWGCLHSIIQADCSLGSGCFARTLCTVHAHTASGHRHAWNTSVQLLAYCASGTAVFTVHARPSSLPHNGLWRAKPPSVFLLSLLCEYHCTVNIKLVCLWVGLCQNVWFRTCCVVCWLECIKIAKWPGSGGARL